MIEYENFLKAERYWSMFMIILSAISLICARLLVCHPYALLRTSSNAVTQWKAQDPSTRLKFDKRRQVALLFASSEYRSQAARSSVNGSSGSNAAPEDPLPFRFAIGALLAAAVLQLAFGLYCKPFAATISLNAFRWTGRTISPIACFTFNS